MIRIIDHREAETLLARRAASLTKAEQVVAPILEAVRKRGDAALIQYARKFDDLGKQTLTVQPAEFEAALKNTAPSLLAALKKAKRNIALFARGQMPEEFTAKFPDGHRAGQIVRPIESMGAYIPAGRYPLPSTLLMTVIPARVAGVPVICAASPRPGQVILATAAFLGVDRVFRMGGAQAIAAFAFGTQTVPRVERIVGPGNIYVAAAKKLLAGEVGIDFVAGPTEILIIAKEGDPEVLAADMLAQAEHDEEAAAILVVTSKRLAAATARAIEKQLQNLPTAATARVAIERNSAIIVAPSLDKAVEISNRFAPEHLTIPDSSLLKRITNAGSIFVGKHSPEAAGDYASGPNHVLPTSGYARVRAGLSAADFVKVISVQELTRAALKKLAPAITTLARAEGLEAHARSVEVRLRG